MRTGPTALREIVRTMATYVSRSDYLVGRVGHLVTTVIPKAVLYQPGGLAKALGLLPTRLTPAWQSSVQGYVFRTCVTR